MIKIRSIRLILRYFYNRYFIISFTLLSIILILIIWQVCIKYLFNKNNIVSTPIIAKKHISFRNVTKIDIDFSDHSVYLSVLRKYLSENTSIKETDIYNHTVMHNEAIINILQKYGKEIFDHSDITLLLRQYPTLSNLTNGQTLSWMITTKKRLQCLVWRVSATETRVYHRINIGFSESKIRIIYMSNDGLSYKILFSGELRDTFIEGVRSLGIEDRYIINIIDALQYQLDFRKLRKKDQFAILIFRKINSNNNIINSKLLGVRLYTSGTNYYIFEANDGKFYNSEAVRTSSNFLQFPIDKPFRISSSFNLNRLNPITRRISPHAGVDFAVPMGTPVLSVGDGEVIVSRYSKVAGNYVVIQHNGHCITRYMHLKKLLVKTGQKVKKGENIALSGNTGRSTGPHLHFELWMNHRPVNPLTTKILNFEQLLGNERVVYMRQIHEVLPQLCFK